MRLRISLEAVLLVGAVAFLACNSAERSGLHSAVPSTSPAISQTAQTTQTANTVHADGVRRITTNELRDLLARGEAVVIDVRNEGSYNAGHIRGAKLIPVNEVLPRISEFPRNKLIVTYCS